MESLGGVVLLLRDARHLELEAGDCAGVAVVPAVILSVSHASAEEATHEVEEEGLELLQLLVRLAPSARECKERLQRDVAGVVGIRADRGSHPSRCVPAGECLGIRGTVRPVMLASTGEGRRRVCHAVVPAGNGSSIRRRRRLDGVFVGLTLFLTRPVAAVPSPRALEECAGSQRTAAHALRIQG